jgi:N4-gp56 family major capsid protein
MSNTSSINSELFAALVTSAQYQAYETSVARQIVTVFDAPINTGKTLQVPVWASIAAQLITDESAATAKGTNTTSVSISLTEHVVYHAVTDMLRDSAYSNVMTQLGDQSGRAIAESMDTQVFGLFSGFAEAGPGANAELTLADILKAGATLRGRKVTGPMFAVIRPEQAFEIKKAMTTANGYVAGSNLQNRALDGYTLGTVGGITIIESALLTVDGSGDSVGAVFAPGAIGHAMRGSLEMETQRQAAARATDVVVKATAGASIINALMGVKLTADATL